jgi:hypothetical protein
MYKTCQRYEFTDLRYNCTGKQGIQSYVFEDTKIRQAPGRLLRQKLSQRHKIIFLYIFMILQIFIFDILIFFFYFLTI